MIVNRYNNLTKEQIIAMIEECVQSGLNSYEETCSHLSELAKRKVSHPLHRHFLLKWYKEVADKKLSMGVVAKFNGNKQYLDCLVGRPIDVQKSIVADAKVSVALRDSRTGDIYEDRKPAAKLAIKDFRRLFPKGKPVATISEQRAALEKEIATQPVTHTHGVPVFTVERAAGKIVIGGKKYPLSAVMLALEEAGYLVTEPETP